MKVWIVGRGCPDEKYVMNGIFEFDQARALKECGVDVVFVAVDLRSIRRKRKWGIHNFVKEDIPVYIANIPVGPLGSWTLEQSGRIAFKYLASKVQKKQGRPDIVHAHFSDTACWTIDYCEKQGIPLIITEHSSQYSAKVMPAKLIIKAKRVFSHAARVVCVSERLKKNIYEQIGIDSICIPNIVDLMVFNHNHENVEKESFEFVSAANLIEWKRMHLLIRAIAKLRDDQRKVHLTIFGEGPQRTELEALIKALNVAQLVELRGAVDRKVIAQEYTHADAFVLASKSETFGVAYVEAMAAGLPVIATKNGGSDEYMQDFNGKIIDVDDEEQLYSAMEYVMDHIDEYDSQKIQSYVRDKYSPEVVAKQIIQVYSQVLSG